MAHKPVLIAIQILWSKCLIVKNGCMAHKSVSIAIQKSGSKCLIVKDGFMAHKPVPIALPDNDILHDDEDCPYLDKITDYLKDLASKTSKTVSFKTRVPTLEIYETNRLPA
ncbi:MAG: hypothetical protein DRR08_21855 [Candidatus Parabeggiatoa sp. nov. 2]|nr:MAG: hypothetical protein B6247_28725 [Beggiatoa sp. 4572_84]RKZ56390.1 MAG: hypothetical protein DRR08_21855 [Gammaproteobacteria bacterium]